MQVINVGQEKQCIVQLDDGKSATFCWSPGIACTTSTGSVTKLEFGSTIVCQIAADKAPVLFFSRLGNQLDSVEQQLTLVEFEHAIKQFSNWLKIAHPNSENRQGQLHQFKSFCGIVESNFRCHRCHEIRYSYIELPCKHRTKCLDCTMVKGCCSLFNINLP